MAAASMALHSLVANSVVSNGRAQFLPMGKRAGRLVVRSQGEAQEQKQKQSSTPAQQPTPVSSTTPTPPSPPPPPTPPRAPKASTSFSDVLAFSGPAPERINGRLAMIGFVAALGSELANGDSVLTQITNGGLPWFVGATAVLSLASLIPLFKGVSVQSKSEGLMNSDAELWNGRFAMLGIVALVFTEYLKGGALV